jgi:hypothetical protein
MHVCKPDPVKNLDFLAKKLGRGGVREGGFALNPTLPTLSYPRRRRRRKRCLLYFINCKKSAV